MVPLTLRPNGLCESPAFAPFTDWSVLEDGQEVGHIYKQYAPATPEMAWFWSITEMVPNQTGAATSGHAATFEDARAQFQEHWFKVWKRAPA
jgi:hypothetical protein